MNLRTGRVYNKQPECPKCGSILDGWTNPDPNCKASPSAGDYTVCAYCYGTLEWQEDQTFKIVPPEAVKDCPDLKIMVDVVKKMMRKK